MILVENDKYSENKNISVIINKELYNIEKIKNFKKPIMLTRQEKNQVKIFNIYNLAKIIILIQKFLKRHRKKQMMKKFLQILLPNTNQEVIVLHEKNKNEKKWENKFQDNYKKLIKTKSNNYFLELVEIMSIRSIYFEYQNYEDNYSFLKIRKILIMLYTFLKYLSFKIVSSVFFSRFILSLIFIDSLIIIMNFTETNYKRIQYFIANFYLIEMILKMIAYGLIFDQDSYFRNRWNFLDFGVVVSIYFFDIFKDNFAHDEISLTRNFVIIRLFKLHSFQIILDRLVYSFLLLYDSLKLILLFLVGFSIIGVQLLFNQLKQKCMNELNGIVYNNFCGNFLCENNFICIKSLTNPDHGMTNFDNVFYGLLQVLRIITLDNWSELQYLLQKTYSNYMICYTIITIIVGNFFILNLMLAVLKVKYSECNPNTINEIKIYLDKYKEKKYDLREVKNKGLYIKNRKSGAKHFGSQATQTKNSFFSNDIITKQRNSKVELAKPLKSIIKAPIIPKSKILELLNFPQFIDRKKIQNLISKFNSQNLNNILKNKNITKNNLGEFEELGKKALELRIKNNLIYEDENSNDVIPSRVRSNKLKQIKFQLDQLYMYSIPITYNFNFFDQYIANYLKKNNDISAIQQISKNKKRELIAREIKIPLKSNNKCFLKQNKIHVGKDKNLTKLLDDLPEKENFTKKHKLDIEINLTNYQEVKDLINDKLIKDNKNLIQNEIEEDYIKIKQEDMKKLIINNNNWSGFDVLTLKTYSSKLTKKLKIDLNFPNINIWIISISGLIILIRKFFLAIALSKLFRFLFIVVEIVNTVFLSLEGIIDNEIWDKLNRGVRFFFISEFLIKIISFGLKKFTSDILNVIDMLSVLYSIVEYFSINYSSTLTIFFGENFLTYFRFLRIFLVLRIIKFCRKLEYMKFIFHVIKNSFKSYSILICLLFLIIFFYALLGRQIFNDSFTKNKPNNRYFTTFGEACITVFTIITLDNWYGIMILGNVNFFYLIIYVVSLIFIGNFIFLNLFLTVLLDSFENETEKINKKKKESSKIIDNEQNIEITLKYNNKNSETSFRSFLIFDDYDKLRLLCQRFLNKDLIKNLFYFSILLNMLVFSFQTFVKNRNSIEFILADNIYFTLFMIYTIEFLLNSISSGLLFTKNAYLKEFSNIINVLSLFGFYLNLLLNNSNENLVFCAKILEMLFPLRIFKHHKNLRRVFLTIIKALDKIFNVLITLLIVWFIFSIWGVHLFRDRFGYCDFRNNLNINMDNCHSKWKIHPVNFDTIYNALFTLLTISTFDSWSDVMEIAVNSDLPINGPHIGNNKYSAYLYFLTFIFVGIWLILNLLLGVIFSNFSSVEQEKKSITLNSEILKWIEIQKKIVHEKPFSYNLPKKGIRLVLFKLIESKKMKIGIKIFLFLNLFRLCIVVDNLPNKFKKIYLILLFLIVIIFMTEYLIKTISHGIFDYYKRKIHIFENLVLIGLILELITFKLEIDLNDKRNIIIKLLSYLSIVRCIYCMKGIKQLLRTLSFSLPLLLNLILLEVIILFIYGSIGNSAFGNISRGTIIGEQINFSNILNSLFSLFKCLTCDQWYDIMFDCMSSVNKNNSIQNSVGFVYIFYISFMIITYFLLFNVFMMILLKLFEEFYKNPLNPIQFYDKYVNKFKIAWSYYYNSEKDKEYLSMANLTKFLKHLGPPLGSSDNFTSTAKKIMKLELRAHRKNLFYFNEILYASIKLYFIESNFFGIINSKADKILDLYEQKFFQKINQKRKQKKVKKFESQIIKKIKTIFIIKKNKKTILGGQEILKKEIDEIINPLYQYLLSKIVVKTWKKFAEKETILKKHKRLIKNYNN